MPKMKRIKRFIEVLELVPEEQFNIEFWSRDKALSVPADVVIPDNFEPVDCQTACCAVGWAAMDKGFRKQGLHLKKIPYAGESIYNIFYKVPSSGREYRGFNAVAKFLGISMSLSGHFFSSSSYNEKFSVKLPTVINRIKQHFKKELKAMPVTKPSQKETVLKHLKSGKSLTALEALGVYRIYRLASRIKELRNDGHAIMSHMKDDGNGKRYASYSLN